LTGVFAWLPIHGTQAKANAAFWKNKIEQNRARAWATNKQLKKLGGNC
jgi:G:T-mismatch repair DNA endonuclease (very short patch repair protein)